MQVQIINIDSSQALYSQRKIYIDSAFFHYLSKEFELSPTFARNVSKKYKSKKILFILRETKHCLIDHNWNDRVFYMVRERCELDNALSWLSTLGGAFSALGDYFERCALIAGKISVNQLRLALKLGDPTIAARCRLYYSLSLIQQQNFKLSKYIILKEYHNAKNSTVIDFRLIRMCKGIWAKLQYEHYVHRTKRKLQQLNINK